MIVLTGGAGFIGSCFLKKLNDNGINDVIVVDSLGNEAKWKNLIGKRFLRFIHKDDFLIELLENPDFEELEAIIHLGACTVTTETDVDYLMDNNLNYSIALAKFCEEFDIRMIYASSAASYGLGVEGYSDTNYFDLKPLNPYGFSKHLFDLWVIENKMLDNFVGLKFFNVFGPNEYHKGSMSSMVYKAYNQIKETGKVRLFKSNHPDYKDGDQKRDFIYVKDVVDVIWNFYKNDDVNGIYNLGSGNARSWNDLANAVFEAMGKKPDIEFVDMPEHLKNQYQNYTQADIENLKKTNCSVEFRSLENSVKDYIQNFLMKDWQYL